jgi:L-ribulose-5-phosphate 3-epimerase
MKEHAISRRGFLASGTAALGAAAISGHPAIAAESSQQASKIVTPPAGKRILLGVKLSMIAKESAGKKLTATERLKMAAEAGFDGVDFDEAGQFTPEQARAAVQESGVFVYNAINHDHWKQRLTSEKEAERNQGVKNIAHCLKVSHAAGGSGVLIVVGRGDDGTEEAATERARAEMTKLIPLAASLGQMILVENVWNKMMYDHDKGPEQSADRFIKFIDSFKSPWVAMYYDVGNHWKYGQPGEWIRAFGPRAVRLDAKGFSRAKDKFVDITSPDDDLPWKEVQKALADIGYAGWATAEVGGGDLKRLTTVREQMQKAFGL